MELVLGGCVIVLASFLAGATGFGFALISTPLLLLIGFPLEFVVTANLTLTLITRIPVSYRFRTHVSLQRALMLILGSIPGFYLGARVLASVDASAINVAAGVAVMVVALLLVFSASKPPPLAIPGAPVAAGLAGGFLGATTSLSGVPPVLLLAHEKAKPRSFLADLAVYFVFSSGIALILLATQGALAAQALFPASLFWLPGALLSTFLGTIVGPRLPEKAFRYFTLLLVFAAGGVTVFMAWPKLVV